MSQVNENDFLQKPPANQAIAYRFQVSEDMTLPAVAQQYDHLTFPRIGRRLEPQSAEAPLLAVIARHDEALVGMALAQWVPDGQAALLISLFVEPQHRQRGLASRLIVHLEQQLAGRGGHRLEAVYQSSWSSCPVVEWLLQKQGWSVHLPHQLLFKMTPAELRQSSIFERYELPPDFTVFPWRDLTPAERQAIQADRDWYPAALDPFAYEPYIEPTSSIGLRYQGQIVGWKIHHCFSPDVIRRPFLFLSEACRGKGVGMAFLVESLRRYLDSGVPAYIAEVDRSNPRLVQWWQRHVIPYLSETVETYRAEKILTTG